MTDTERLDWLESLMRPAEGFTEVYLAGFRNGNGPKATPEKPDWTATAYQVEIPNPDASYRVPFTGKTLREAIDNARSRS